jgi:hypothetical protein
MWSGYRGYARSSALMPRSADQADLKPCKRRCQPGPGGARPNGKRGKAEQAEQQPEVVATWASAHRHAACLAGRPHRPVQGKAVAKRQRSSDSEQEEILSRTSRKWCLQRLTTE